MEHNWKVQPHHEYQRENLDNGTQFLILPVEDGAEMAFCTKKNINPPNALALYNLSRNSSSNGYEIWQFDTQNQIISNELNLSPCMNIYEYIYMHIKQKMNGWMASQAREIYPNIHVLKND